MSILPYTFEDIIAARFLNSLTHRALNICADCGIQPQGHYVITKRYVNGKPAFDMVSCNSCSTKLLQMASPESQAHILHFSTTLARRMAMAMLEATVEITKSEIEGNDSDDDISLENMIEHVLADALTNLVEPSTQAEPVQPTCIWTGNTIAIRETFSIVSIVMSGNPLINPKPYYFLTDAHMDEMFNGMSKQTQDTWSRYYQELFPDISPSLLPIPESVS